MFFNAWDSIVRIIVVGVLAYTGLLLPRLRVSGSRTLSKMNSFDLVVTVAFGPRCWCCCSSRSPGPRYALASSASWSRPRRR